MNTNWKRSASTAVTVLLFAAALATAKFPSLGKSTSKSTSKSVHVDISSVANFGNGVELQPGSYKLTVVDGSNPLEVAFYNNGKLVAQVAARLVDEGKKANQTEIESNIDTHTITEIRPQGWTQGIVFGDGNASTNSGQ